MDGGGEGTKNHPPPKKPGLRDPTTAKAGQGRRSRRAHSGIQWRTTAAQGPFRGNPMAPTAPGPKTAFTRAVSTTYWRWRPRRGVVPTWGTPLVRPAMGPLRIRKGQNRRRRGTKPCSARSPREATTESRTRQGDPLNGRSRLTRAAAKGEKEGGGTPQPAARAHRAQRGHGGAPLNMVAQNPTARPGPGRRWGPPSLAARATRARAGGGMGQAAHIHNMYPKVRGKGGSPQTAAYAPSARHASKGGGGIPKPGGGGGGTP